jgi:undecaprenyl-diphosphatase
MKRVFQVVTHLGDGEIWIAVYAASFIFFREYLSNIIFPVVFAEIIGLMMSISIRYAVKRERPERTYRAHFLTPWNRYSLPSGHALRSFIIAVTVGTQYPEMLFPLLVMAGMICFSRVYLGKHYLSDILVGAMMGGVLAAVSVHLLS